MNFSPAKNRQVSAKIGRVYSKAGLVMYKNERPYGVPTAGGEAVGTLWLNGGHPMAAADLATQSGELWCVEEERFSWKTCEHQDQDRTALADL